jgi:hypothetical protein
MNILHIATATFISVLFSFSAQAEGSKSLSLNGSKMDISSMECGLRADGDYSNMDKGCLPPEVEYIVQEDSFQRIAFSGRTCLLRKGEVVNNNELGGDAFYVITKESNGTSIMDCHGNIVSLSHKFLEKSTTKSLLSY